MTPSRQAKLAPLTASRVPLSPVAWTPQEEMELPEWLAYGRRLGAIGRSVAWWIGDWLRYGNARYGEKYRRAAHVTGYDNQSLMNMVYVASRFAPEQRRAGLSWSHHAEVAALEEAERERWLDLAEAERMSVRSLRTELQTARRTQRTLAGAEPAGPELTAAGAHHLVCPHCRSVIDWRSSPDVGRRALGARRDRRGASR